MCLGLVLAGSLSHSAALNFPNSALAAQKVDILILYSDIICSTEIKRSPISRKAVATSAQYASEFSLSEAQASEDIRAFSFLAGQTSVYMAGIMEWHGCPLGLKNGQ
ncbi:hypothetical protein O6H91_14G076200 [Diphasiastrum complanatum]|uniref:Uncharacterized protein n=1 Tax=Diphasiastrum complanatum TaxID=34168 RepID=A0ACC2BQX7_DIPCM|nr:hypothetical protein O6H91_14G076200 [Diphasiastrum complanatum]